MNREFLRQCVLAACYCEAAAPKAGNVHPDASFVDCTFDDFVRSAHAIAPILANAPGRAVGLTIFECAQATREVVGKNTNLGIILLLAPLAAVPPDVPLSAGISDVLGSLTIDDAEQTYAAIRLAQPGGLGQAGEQDVGARPSVNLRDAMRLAADRDSIASEYATCFQTVLSRGLMTLAGLKDFEANWRRDIMRLQLEIMALQIDTLIQRKCGAEIAREAQMRARSVLDAGWPEIVRSQTMWKEFDSWLRADGHRRNPGSTADLIAAALFAAFRERRLPIVADWMGAAKPA